MSEKDKLHIDHQMLPYLDPGNYIDIDDDDEDEEEGETNLSETERAEQEVDRLHEEEIERRKWCVEQATFQMETTEETFLRIADKIYDWVFGKQP